jgi:hypothetical protein
MVDVTDHLSPSSHYHPSKKNRSLRPNRGKQDISNLSVHSQAIDQLPPAEDIRYICHLEVCSSVLGDTLLDYHHHHQLQFCLPISTNLNNRRRNFTLDIIPSPISNCLLHVPHPSRRRQATHILQFSSSDGSCSISNGLYLQALR